MSPIHIRMQIRQLYSFHHPSLRGVGTAPWVCPGKNKYWFNQLKTRKGTEYFLASPCPWSEGTQSSRPTFSYSPSYCQCTFNRSPSVCPSHPSHQLRSSFPVSILLHTGNTSIFLLAIHPHFHLPDTSILCLSSANKSMFISAGLLPFLFVFLHVGMDYTCA